MRRYYVGVCGDCNTGKTVYLRTRKPPLCDYHSKKRNHERTNNRKRKSLRADVGATAKVFRTFRKGGHQERFNHDAQKWYAKSWESRPHICEECGKFLGHKMRRIYISHILTKGAHPALRTHPLNFNILCEQHHHPWEFGSRKDMKIYWSNKATIQKLLDYERENSK